MFSQLTQGCTSINSFVPSLPAAFISSGSPPGWKGNCEGVTRWNVSTPAKTLPRELGVETAVPFGERPPLARCWLLAGGPRLGNGPVEGIRREDAALGGGPRCGTAGRDGGGINPAAGFGGGGPDMDAGLGGGGISEVFCALLAAVKHELR
ncbi:hypothetical protein KC363_g226 [Hortaea werneckii]|nr:hypothetical protein KC363_g226 [Hortaea werneckii]